MTRPRCADWRARRTIPIRGDVCWRSLAIAVVYDGMNVWRYLRQTYLSNRVFDSDDAIIDAACDAWNQLIDMPWTIMSIGMREWAHRGQTRYLLVLEQFPVKEGCACLRGHGRVGRQKVPRRRA